MRPSRNSSSRHPSSNWFYEPTPKGRSACAPAFCVWLVPVRDSGSRITNQNLRITNQNLRITNQNLRITNQNLRITNQNLRITAWLRWAVGQRPLCCALREADLLNHPPCHPERSEGSLRKPGEMLRCAQHDMSSGCLSISTSLSCEQFCNFTT